MNVRWDAVVTKRKFAPSRRACDRADVASLAADGPVEVRVRLFGMMVRPEVTNPMVLRFAQSCALSDVIEELGRRVGPELHRTLIGESGEPRNTCRLFLDGEPVQDMATRLSPAPEAPTVEIILFREIEGG